MKKALFILFLLLVPTVSAQAQLQIDALEREMRLMRNHTSVVCDQAIRDYRAEATRVIETEKDNLFDSVHDYLRRERFLFMVATGVSAFIGALGAMVAIQKMKERGSL